uniref:Uncharacterized protein n=1 Tax=Rangifer tarandus platyrhynchus TaxID=3082113 RepID=A0ACB0F5C0_RANTA|nr:unnamed protein product [Rangifer tarandus platyrhynchus]
MHRDFPGTCPAESRPASEEGCVTRAQQVSACRWAGDGGTGARRRGLTGGPARSPERAICCALDGELRGIHGCPTAPEVRSVPSSGPGRPRESKEPGAPGGRPGFGEPLGQLCALPGPSPSSAFVFSLSFPSSSSTTLPLLQFGSCTPPACSTLQPRAAEAPSEGEASAGHGAARSEGGRAAGSAMEEKPQLSGGSALPRARVRREVPAVPPRAAPLPPSTCALGRMRGDAAGAMASAGGCLAVGGHAGLSDASGRGRIHLVSLGQGFQSFNPRVCTRFSLRPMLS